MKTLNNREVEVTDLEPGDGTMMITNAYYVDTDDELTPDELSQLEWDYPEFLDEEYFEYQIRRAEAAFEGDR